jgi:hypothetical protein
MVGTGIKRQIGHKLKSQQETREIRMEGQWSFIEQIGGDVPDHFLEADMKGVQCAGPESYGGSPIIEGCGRRPYRR